jgi:hypothetical protein
MKFVDQTTFGEKNGNCFSACVASILELPIEDVPIFVEVKNWWGEFLSWLKPRGYYALCYHLKDCDKSVLDDYEINILSGKSPRGDFLHAVVANGSKILHDPHPSRDGIGELSDFIIIVKGSNL